MWSPPPPDVDPVPIPLDDPIPNVWIPYSPEEHPYHCQIHRDAFPYSVVPGDIGVDHRAIIDLRWFLQKEVRWQDHMTFSDTYTDLYGMPQITFKYELSEQDARNLHSAFFDMERAASALGGYLTGTPPQGLPRGSSLHYQGTYRMQPGQRSRQRSLRSVFARLGHPEPVPRRERHHPDRNGLQSDADERRARARRH
jgi:pyranose oxidase